VINGSPLADSSVSRMLAALAEGARAGGATTEAFDCYALSVKPCVACGPDATSGWCIYHDDMDPVYAALERAQAVVVGSPVYFDTVSAPLKLVIDRCNCITPLVRLPDGSTDIVVKWPRTRRGVFVTACSSNHTHEYAERTVRGWFKWVGAKWQESIVWRHADDERGSVPADLVEYARLVGRQLAQSPPLAPEPAPGPASAPPGKPA
jgi:NAD(P)H-dependent FMN reductase